MLIFVAVLSMVLITRILTIISHLEKVTALQQEHKRMNTSLDFETIVE